ncbi:alpha/beta hydrolase [Mangrovimonas sp. CR14]|uniref:alpha/beta hydrolase n=1 Tax=Mangrovimonas sp. CR14 TaxID=2706120 RepID=UPI00141DA134|nr:alpha/beta hydrolase [Mangrovimonas sp. CR14]NIK93316.1 alpha/beta hydrolase [Mangrovimonas sp. CR14]
MRNKKYKWVLLLCLVAANYALKAQDQVVKLYDGVAPGSEEWDWKEAEMYSDLFGTEVVYNVTSPEMLVFKPEAGKGNGTSIIIAPGGGFQSLSINREGTILAKELAAKGITAFVLKYRLLETKTKDPAREMMDNLTKRDEFNKRTAMVQELAGNDIRKAIGHVRSQAKAYRIDPEKVGVIGFSAGAMVIMQSVLKSSEKETRPNFAASIYGGASQELLSRDLPAEKIPLFICAATDDQLGLAPSSILLYNKWLSGGYPVELHMYANGGHGFGMGKQGLPVDTWNKRFEDWLQQFKFL